MKITIGKTADDKPFHLPTDVVTSTLVVYGGKGMGKTNFGNVLVEQLTSAGLRWSVLDPLGVWWGLRHSADGKGNGVECLILGGAHGDIPIEPTGGAVAADLVVDETVNVVIDFSREPSGKMWSIGEKIRFITEYAYRLFQRQGELVDGRRREPIFQVLDEAARYIPQVIPSGAAELAKCVSAWEQLVEEGRNIGIGVGLLTQRSARMNKSVSEVADAIFAFRIVGPNSIGAITDWLGEHVPKKQVLEMVETIRSLPRGECLVVSPGWLKFEAVVKIDLRTTFDSSATPKPGERPRKVTGVGAQPDLAKYAERMRETVERVKENDPRELKRQIADLRKQLAKNPGTPKETKAPKVDERALRSQITAAVSAAIEQRDNEWVRSVGEYQISVGKLLDGVQFKAPRKAAAPALPPRTPPPGAVLVNKPYIPKHDISKSYTPAESNGDLKPAHIKILSRLVELMECTGRAAIPKEQLAAWSEYSPTGGGYGNYLGTLRTAGLIDYPSSGQVTITDGGRKLAQPEDVPADSAEMLERAKGILGGSEARILEAVFRVYPDSLSKAELADRTGFSAEGGGYGNYLGHMRTLGFIDYPQKGHVRAADWLFLE
jgi:uncharacterized protein